MAASSEDQNPSNLKIFDVNSFTSMVKLAVGGEAVAYKAKSKTFGDVCVKLYNANEDNGREIELLLERDRHPNIITIYGLFVEESIHWGRRTLGYVMELMPGGNVASIIHSEVLDPQYTVSMMLNWIVDACRGLIHLHEVGIIHRDVKPANMLLYEERKRLKLSDFGITKTLNAPFTCTKGTFIYQAPELMSSSQENYSLQQDIYSLGISTWEIFHRRAPYDIDVYDLPPFVKGGGRPKISDELDPRIKKIIEGAWNQDPEQRLSLAEIIILIEKIQETENINPYIWRPSTIEEILRPNTFKKPYEIDDEHWNLSHLYGILFALEPAGYKNAIAKIRWYIQQCLHHFDHLAEHVPYPIISKQVTYMKLRHTGEVHWGGENIFHRYQAPSEAITHIKDPQEFSYILVWQALLKNGETDEKLKAIDRDIAQIDDYYKSSGEQVLRSLRNIQPYWLIIGDGTCSANIFKNLFEKQTAGKTNPEQLYCIQIIPSDFRKNERLVDLLDVIWNRIERMKNVVMIDFLLDESRDHGIFEEEWEVLASDIYTSFSICCSKAEDCPRAREKFCASLSKVKTTFNNVQAFVKEEVDGKTYLKDVDVYQEFWMVRMRYIKNLILGRRTPLNGNMRGIRWMEVIEP